MKRNLLSERNTYLYNTMCAIEKDVYALCNNSFAVYSTYISNNPTDWHTTSEDEMIRRYESTPDSEPLHAFVQVHYGYDVLGDMMDKYASRLTERLESYKKAWEFIDRITQRALVLWRSANRELIAA